jgi:predicted dinucleotide-binding enzyme
MKVAIIGPESIGKSLAKRLDHAGHGVRLSFSRDEAKLRAVATSRLIEPMLLLIQLAYGRALRPLIPFNLMEQERMTRG